MHVFAVWFIFCAIYPVKIVRYVTRDGISPFDAWFDRLSDDAPFVAGRVMTGIERVAQGNTGALKSLGGGLAELRYMFGPGFRVYCHRDGPLLLVLFGGGSKSSQARDIERARELLAEYLERKR